MTPPTNLSTLSLDDESLKHANSLLSEAAQWIASGQPTAIERAISVSRHFIDDWYRPEFSSIAAVKRFLAMACLVNGNALRETHKAELRPAALQSNEQALEHFQSVMEPEDPDDLNHLAKLWINRGITLLDDNSAPALAEALPCFERAISLRQKLPLEKNKFFIWGLAAAWMNCADVLTRLGSTVNLERALSCYDEAIALLQRMPLDEHPTYPARLALAWMNRGLTAQAQETPVSMHEALRCFTQSIEQFPGHGAASAIHPEQRRILSCAHVNRGHAILKSQPAQPIAARQDAIAALGLVAEFERNEVLAAQIGLQSRHLLCRGIAHLVDLDNVPGDWITEATDAVDDGMELARHWRQLGETRLSQLESELFRFGALIYRLCQPHFLAEFLVDSMDPTRSTGAPVNEESIHHIATDALWSAIMDIHARQQSDPTRENQTRLLARLDELQQTEKRLNELRVQYLCAAHPTIECRAPLNGAFTAA